MSEAPTARDRRTLLSVDSREAATTARNMGMIGQQQHRVVGVIAIAIMTNAVVWIIYGLSIPICTFHAVRQARSRIRCRSSASSQ